MKCFCCLVLTVFTIAAGPVKRIPDANGDALAVVVPGDMALVHTTQFVTADLGPHLAEMGDAVKINVVASTPATAEAARKSIRNAFPAGQRPALSVVLGAMPQERPLAVDAVLATTGKQSGARIYISGQAEKGATPAEAAAKTLASLVKTLDFVGCKPADVLQAKCFLTPISAQADVIAKFEKVFGERQFSLVFVEWNSDLPIEIELVVSGPAAAADAPAVEYLTPPGKTASPLFARVVRVNRGDLIYIGDLYSAKPASGEGQVLSIFDQLQDVLKRSNSDLRHLVKATYFVSGDDASKQLNILRPKYYDPARPPAASKAMVSGIGMLDRSISIDMIAVTVTP